MHDTFSDVLDVQKSSSSILILNNNFDMYIGQNLVHGKVLVQIHSFLFLMGLPCWLSGEPIYTAGDAGDPGSVPDLGRSPGGGNGNLLTVFLPGVSGGQKSLAGCSP